MFLSDELAGSSEEELSGGEIEVQENPPRGEDRDLKDKLLRKYSGYLSSLKQEFSKKKKKGKLPKEARQTLLDWWNIHLKWPYPTVSLFFIGIMWFSYPCLSAFLILPIDLVGFMRHYVTLT